MPATISACIITYNEQDNIVDCLESIKWADEIIVVDSYSTDKTVELARKYTDKVYLNPWSGYSAQRSFAVEKATCEWVLLLDADERVTPALKDELLREIANTDCDGFYVKRHTYYLGKWINHCGWYPDYKLRIARREKVKCIGVDPHDRLIVDGKTRYLKSELSHFTYKNFSDQLKTIDNFSDIEAKRWAKERRFNLILAIMHPLAKFFEVYFWKKGFLDGWQGFVISIASAFYVFCKYVKLWEIEKKL